MRKQDCLWDQEVGMINASPMGREELGSGWDVEKNMASLWLSPLCNHLLASSGWWF